ncbi:MAG: LysM peptidoglycan-binding domain-containing protein [Roseiflexaceae bacterium]|nr:LysM peptidoglycan-binding domain-containing protein [Roseiflexaceae bacterium]
MNTSKLAKASITNVDKGGAEIRCMFNPKEYTFTKQNSWSEPKKSGTNVPPVEFGGGQPAQFQMQLFFDTYATGEDVRKTHTDAIWELMLIDESILVDKKSKKGRPPIVRFQWGAMWSFEAVILSITQKFTLFLHDGTPVRATLDVTFRQIKDSKLLPSQNPTSGGDGGERYWTVNEGETLAWISYKTLGDSTDWRRIADANRLTHVRDLAPGTVLVIPNG